MNKIIIILLLILFLIVFGILFMQNREIAIVQGDSMFPTFKECTILLYLKNYPPQNLLVGNIAVVEINQQTLSFKKIAHRIVENNIELQTIALRGDNNSYYDYPSSIDGYFSYEKIKGKVENYFNLPKIFCSEQQ